MQRARARERGRQKEEKGGGRGGGGGSGRRAMTGFRAMPWQEDESRLGAARDIFGRERFADDRADMGGVGSFSRESCVRERDSENGGVARWERGREGGRGGGERWRMSTRRR